MHTAMQEVVHSLEATFRSVRFTRDRARDAMLMDVRHAYRVLLPMNMGAIESVLSPLLSLENLIVDLRKVEELSPATKGDRLSSIPSTKAGTDAVTRVVGVPVKRLESQQSPSAAPSSSAMLAAKIKSSASFFNSLFPQSSGTAITATSASVQAILAKDMDDRMQIFAVSETSVTTPPPLENTLIRESVMVVSEDDTIPLPSTSLDTNISQETIVLPESKTSSVVPDERIIHEQTSTDVEERPASEQAMLEDESSP
jgi:hypothetical protein